LIRSQRTEKNSPPALSGSPAGGGEAAGPGPGVPAAAGAACGAGGGGAAPAPASSADVAPGATSPATTYTVDLAAGLLELAAADVPGGVRHATNAGETTWYSFARAILEELGEDPALVALLLSLASELRSFCAFAY
jgi:hypothetical protein